MRNCCRREWLVRSGSGLGAIALTWLLDGEGRLHAFDPTPLPANPQAPRKPHFEPRAQRVISLFMDGAPSHIELFDPKPELTKRAGDSMPESMGNPQGGAGAKIIGMKSTFRKHGQSGVEICDWLPNLGTVADHLTVVRSCHTDIPEHVQAIRQMHTGFTLTGKASVGAWSVYGLGSISQDLPGFVVMTDGAEPTGGTSNWGPGILPASYQGTPFRGGANPVPHLNPPPGISTARQKAKLELLKELNDEHRKSRADDDELAARIHAYEVAYRMQSSAPKVADLRDEDEATKKLYGIDRPECAEFGRKCLTARRLIEKGVRFIEIYCGAGGRWDAHADLVNNHTGLCARFDRPMAGLIQDLKQRGLLDSTLVIWNGEFGRTPTGVSGTGRDHNNTGFTTVLAGGGTKGGLTYGGTDDFGMKAVKDPVHVRDLHATILHLMGLDHTKLTYVHSGRLERLTGTGGNVVRGVLA